MSDPFARIPITDTQYTGTPLELPQERSDRLAADPVPPQEEEG